MVDALYRVSYGTRAIDWLILGVDGLVLFVIVLFEGPEWWHKRHAAKKAQDLSPFLAKGRELQRSVPCQIQMSSPELMQWDDAVHSWGRDTEAFLAHRSKRAALAFTHVINASSVDRDVRRDDGDSFHLSGRFGDTLQVLHVKLDNLQRIIEKPEIYF